MKLQMKNKYEKQDKINVNKERFKLPKLAVSKF